MVPVPNWKLPKQVDELFYNHTVNIKVLTEPIAMGKRGVFQVAEMDKFT